MQDSLNVQQGRCPVKEKKFREIGVLIRKIQLQSFSCLPASTAFFAEESPIL